MRSSRLFAGVLLPLLLLGAKKERAPEPAPPTAAAIIETMKVDATVAVLDVGAEPRQVVRFAPRPGASATLELTQRTEMSMIMNGQSMALPANGMVTTSRTSVGTPDADGAVRVRVEQLGLRALDGPNPAIEASAAALRGMVTELVVSPEGRITGFAMVGGDDPAMNAAIQSLSESLVKAMPALPAEAVGIGARWRSEVALDMAGLSFVAETVSVVTGFSEGGLDLAVTTTLRKGDSPAQFPGLPPGAELSFTRLDGTGTGTQHVDLATLATTMDQRLTLDMEMAMTMPDAPAGQGSMTIAMHMDQSSISKVVGP